MGSEGGAPILGNGGGHIREWWLPYWGMVEAIREPIA